MQVAESDRRARSESFLGRIAHRIGEILAAHEGEVTLENHWGVRRLAYEIEHENKGNYMFLKFSADGTACAELDKFLRQDDQVLRHLVVRDEDRRGSVAVEAGDGGNRVAAAVHEGVRLEQPHPPTGDLALTDRAVEAPVAAQ